MRSVCAFHSNFFDGFSCCIATCISARVNNRVLLTLDFSVVAMKSL